VERLRALGPDSSRFAQVLRDTLDQLLDGRRTGLSDARSRDPAQWGVAVPSDEHIVAPSVDSQKEDI
jgi:hypothetical protein